MPKCGSIGSFAQNQALRAHVWEKNGPKTARTATEFGLARPEQEIMPETQNTPTSMLAQNAPFAHLGAPRGCQSVLLSVHMAKTGHSGCIFERKTARKRPVTWPN
jgi:hypothetical protein